MDDKPSKEDLQSINLSLKKKIETLQDAEKINYLLYDISNAVNSTRNLEALYQSIYHSLNKLIPLPNFFIAIYDNKKKTINFEFFIDEYDDDFSIVENLEKPNSLTGEVILARRPLFLKENMLLERAKKNRIKGTIPKIWLGVPLIIQETVIGAICVQNYTDPDYFSHKHLEILISVSDQIAIAIERKQILDALEKKEKHIKNGSATILVIEDEDMVREMMIKTLASFEYNTIEACDGKAGLELYKKNYHRIDAVLLDIIMPKMSGMQAFEQMLKINPDVKVIITSGHVTRQDQKTMFTKAAAYLDKPFQMMELKKTLHSILS